MRTTFLSGLFIAVAAFSACDSTTDIIGTSLNNNSDGVVTEAASFDVASRSLVVDSVLSRSTTGYLGKVKDPETGDYITSDFMTQFVSLGTSTFPSKDSLAVGVKGAFTPDVVRADSCVLRLFFNSFYGDSTQTMKLTAYEMSKPMEEGVDYYSNYSPIAKGLVRTDAGSATKDVVYSLVDYVTSKSTRDSANYVKHISVTLNSPYTDKEGKSYNNYGTYIMEKYFEHPEYFKNSYNFIHNVVPGFFFKHKSGLGSMANVYATNLVVYYKMVDGDSLAQASSSFWGTEEVLQTTTVSNNRKALEQLAEDNSCTYLKSPSGIITELTLPIDDILNGHANDTINVAKIVLPRLNNTNQNSYALPVPQNVVILPKDSLSSFFTNREIYNNVNSYAATWGVSSSTTANSYAFNNISGLINAMRKSDRKSADWNKVVVVPVEVSTATTSSGYNSTTTTTVITKVSNNMTLTSTKLVKGTSTNSPLKISVIYSKFK